MKKYIVCVGLNDKKTRKQEITTLDAYKIASNIFFEYTDGATITEGVGIYKHDDGQKVKETTLVCTVYDAEKEQIEAAAAALKVALNQESVAIECAEVNSWFF